MNITSIIVLIGFVGICFAAAEAGLGNPRVGLRVRGGHNHFPPNATNRYLGHPSES